MTSNGREKVSKKRREENKTEKKGNKNQWCQKLTSRVSVTQINMYTFTTHQPPPTTIATNKNKKEKIETIVDMLRAAK